MSRTVLVVAAHPDDEVLGMGGTMARHRSQGDDVHVLFLADGVSSRPVTGDDAKRGRVVAAEHACEVLGAHILSFEAFPDNAFDSVPLLTITHVIDRAKATVVPDLIYTHHGGDLNVDHRVTAQAVMTTFRPQPQESYTEILAFEVCSSTEWSHPSLAAPFLPDTYVDIGRHLETKLAAYECYAVEQREDPHARSFESVQASARYRGRQVGVAAAEAFITLRRIVRADCHEEDA